jgi:hypothetical protein
MMTECSALAQSASTTGNFLSAFMVEINSIDCGDFKKI